MQAAVLANQASNYLTGGTVPGRLGNAHPNIVPYQAFATADGHLILAVGNDSQFRRLCTVLDMPDWADNSDYATNSARVVNRQSLCGEISQRLTQYGSAHWLHLLEQHQVPCGPINSIDQVFQDPQILARNMLVTMEDKRAGEVQLVGNPINYSRSGIEYTAPPPILGDNTDSVLGEYLEYSELEISTLRNKSII